MAFVVVQESARDIPQLSLTVEHHTSTSPFPSPGSPFLPPPKLNAHEFAAKPAGQTMRAIDTKRTSSDGANGASRTLDGEATPTIPIPASTPVTPTPQSFQMQAPPPPVVTIPDPPFTPSEKHLQRESLTSSRPAPPSPAESRRASAALSRHSSYAKSRPQSRVTSLSQSTLPSDIPTQPDYQPEGSSSTVVSPKRRSLLMKIRDFAFSYSDDRYVGKGPDVPRPNRPRYRGSTYSTSSSCEEESSIDAEDEQRAGGWGSFRWNTLSQHFWGSKRADTEEVGPSRTDFDRNFESSSSPEGEAEPDHEYEDEDEDEDEDDYPQPGEDVPLVPGIYRALYAFEPEGTAEMALEDEQMVHVVGRGGGVGWAIVEKDGGGHALVPESYLELVQADDDTDMDA